MDNFLNRPLSQKISGSVTYKERDQTAIDFLKWCRANKGTDYISAEELYKKFHFEKMNKAFQQFANQKTKSND